MTNNVVRVTFGIFIYRQALVAGWNSLVGIGTYYRLDGMQISSRWGWGVRFSETVRTGLRAHPASYKKGTRFFPRGKATGAWY